MSPTSGEPRRRPRRSDAETERLMLDAAIELVAEQGLSVGLDQVSLESVIARADVSRASAYRRWPSKDLFLADLAVAIAQDTDLIAEPPGMVQDLSRLIAATDLTDAQARRQLFIESLRLSAGAEYERLAASPRWRNFLALTATVTSMPPGPVRSAATAAIAAAEERFNTRRIGGYRNLVAMIGYRFRTDLPGGSGLELLSRTSGAMMAGLIAQSYRQTPAESRVMAPFGGLRAEWTNAQFALVLIIDSLLEPDPDAEWSASAIAERLSIWQQTAAELDSA